MQHRISQRLDAQAQRLDQAAMRLARPSQALTRHQHALGLLAHRMLASCLDRTRAARQRLPVLQSRLTRAADVQWAQRGQALSAWDARLSALSPHKVLERGYAWLSRPDGTPVTSAAQAAAGDAMQAVLADGVLHLSVTQVKTDAAAAD
jgi:exodeoxyribonuclease VII large subunit